jgi:hypothetical protein
VSEPRYVYHPRAGRVAVETVTPIEAPKKKRERPFKSKFVQVPTRWMEVLRKSNSASTYQLALAVLDEAFEREQTDAGEVILSSKVTHMPRNTRMRAVRELVELGLIEVEQSGRQAVRVSRIHHKIPK